MFTMALKQLKFGVGVLFSFFFPCFCFWGAVGARGETQGFGCVRQVLYHGVTPQAGCF